MGHACRARVGRLLRCPTRLSFSRSAWSASLFVCLSVCLPAGRQAGRYVGRKTRKQAPLCMYAYMDVCVSVRMYVCMYVFACTEVGGWVARWLGGYVGR